MTGSGDAAGRLPGTDDRDGPWLVRALGLARRCPPSATAFSVGALVVAWTPDAEVVGEGWSRAQHPADHAEEVALRGVAPGDPRLATATLYSTLEPYSARASRPRTCTELILEYGIPRVVFAWREPDVFVDCQGAELLAAAGVEVIERPDLAAEARAVNAHLLG